MFKVPVLLIVYNRIEETHNVFQVLRTIQPTELYVAGDGCKKDNMTDRARTYQTRSVIQPAWPCQLHTFWQDEHLGKSEMMFRAMQWFFEQEEEGVILLEDSVPSYDFFPYCEELLSRYRNNEHIFSIGGTYLRHRSRKRYNKRLRKGGASYFFSAYGTSWGFATWKNRWQDFTLSMDQYNSENFQKITAPYHMTKKQRIYWIRRFNILKKYNVSYWDYQINLHIWSHQGFCITPYLNLVTNIGFKKQEKRRVRHLKKNAYPIMPLSHPEEQKQNFREDRYMFKHIFKRAFLYLFRDWLQKILPGKNE